MSEKLRILITNDDGYFAKGIQTLYSTLAKENDVTLVAPDREQSASSHSLTLNRPLRMRQIDEHCYTTDGTPTDCVMLAVHKIFKGRKPDMIVSGINHGANMGDDVTYSGTVAAAIEGSILGINSISVSMANYEPGMSMTRASRFVTKLIRRYSELGLDATTFLNINFPGDKFGSYSNFEFTELGIRHYKDIIIHKTDPRGHDYYWIGGRPKWKATPGSDFDAVQRGVISISPLRLAFTDNDTLRRLSAERPKLR